MDPHPYHHYLFFHVENGFYGVSALHQKKAKEEFAAFLGKGHDDRIVTSYAAAGFKPDTTFMLWVRGKEPEAIQRFLRLVMHTKLGHYLLLTHTYFGIERASEYTGRTGRPEQVMQMHDDRLPYFVLYPFTKTHEWHALEAEKRKEIMSEHVNVGLGYPAIRQCLLYSYGVDDPEFLVSYEMSSLEEFQDLVMKMRRTKGRKYTLSDTPIYTCIHKAPKALMELL